MPADKNALIVVSLNICHGGGSRVQGIFDWLMSLLPDLIILPEWRSNTPGCRIKHCIEGAGFRVATAFQGKSNGILVAAKNGSFGYQRLTPICAKRGELLHVEVANFKMLATYFPQGKAKAPFFQKCMEEASRAKSEPLLVIGDMNTGRNDLDVEGRGTPFTYANLFEELQAKGELIDLWRVEHGDTRDWTWRSPRNGFRVDHALANTSFQCLFSAISCLYDHSPRENSLTDHSALILKCAS